MDDALSMESRPIVTPAQHWPTDGLWTRRSVTYLLSPQSKHLLLFSYMYKSRMNGLAYVSQLLIVTLLFTLTALKQECQSTTHKLVHALSFIYFYHVDISCLLHDSTLITGSNGPGLLTMSSRLLCDTP